MDAVAKRLEAWGEQFMAGFDDSEPKKKKKKKTPGKVEENTAGGSGSKPGDSAAVAAAGKGAAGGKGRAGDAVRKGSSRMAGAAVETVDFVSLAGARPGGGAGGVGGDIVAKLERRSFMSAKVAKIRRPAGALPGGRGAGEEEEEGLSPELFKKIQEEVEMLGASQLDGKERKQWEARRLESLGAKAEKAPRMTANIGVGLKRKREEREHKKIEEEIAAGMRDRKDAHKKPAAAPSGRGERGLKSSDGVFKGGVLHVKPPPDKKKKSGGGGGKKGKGNKGGGGKKSKRGGKPMRF